MAKTGTFISVPEDQEGKSPELVTESTPLPVDVIGADGATIKASREARHALDDSLVLSMLVDIRDEIRRLNFSIDMINGTDTDVEDFNDGDYT